MQNKPAVQKLLTFGNLKIAKGLKKGWLTAGMHLAPFNLSGHQVCPMASAGCAAVCLNQSGHGRFDRTQQARIKKTKRFFADREQFMTQLVKEIGLAVKKAVREGKKLAVRLNLTSDIQWENYEIPGTGMNVFERFPSVTFYDYTKIAKRLLPGSKAAGLPNYHLTFSRSESNEELAKVVAQAGGNVAVVFSQMPKAETFWGRPVVNGDETDLRFLDPAGSIIALVPKGSKAKVDKSGFVVEVAS